MQTTSRRSGLSKWHTSALRRCGGPLLCCCGLLVAAFCVLAAGATPGYAADEVQVVAYPEHVDLSYYLDGQGAKHPVQTVADWERRRKHILQNMQAVMGPVPGDDRRVPLDVEQEESVAVGNLTRRKITFQSEPGDRVAAYLFLPAAGGPARPAILCLHQTTGIGKSEPAGLGGNPNLHYALHLAQAGFVTLAPDYPSFGEHRWEFDGKGGYISGTMKAVWDNMRAVDLLQALPEVDRDRIGCIGHSLGGHNTLFTAAFEPRIKALISNCGFTRFHKYYGGKLAGWTSNRYMPLIASRYDNNPDRVPFDFTEIVGSLAPRPFLASAPVRDGNFEVSGVRDVIAAATPIYALYDKADNLQAIYPDSAHDLPLEARHAAVAFFNKHLQPK